MTQRYPAVGCILSLTLFILKQQVSDLFHVWRRSDIVFQAPIVSQNLEYAGRRLKSPTPNSTLSASLYSADTSARNLYIRSGKFISRLWVLCFSTSLTLSRAKVLTMCWSEELSGGWRNCSICPPAAADNDVGSFCAHCTTAATYYDAVDCLMVLDWVQWGI